MPFWDKEGAAPIAFRARFGGNNGTMIAGNTARVFGGATTAQGMP